MSRDRTEIIYAINLSDWINGQVLEIERQREEWKSETIQCALYWKALLLSELSQLLGDLEVTVKKDSIVKAEPGAY